VQSSRGLFMGRQTLEEILAEDCELDEGAAGFLLTNIAVGRCTRVRAAKSRKNLTASQCASRQIILFTRLLQHRRYFRRSSITVPRGNIFGLTESRIGDLGPCR